MVHINEWMPDPGPNSSEQWIELFNDSNVPVDLSGWHLQTIAKKPIAISGVIGANGYKVLKKEDFKFTLRKSEGELALFDNSNRFVDAASYHGKAVRYASVNRIDQATFFGEPSPGTANLKEVLIDRSYPLNIPLPGTVVATGTGYGTFFGMLLGTALALAIAVIFMFTMQDDLSELFFQGH